MLILIGIPDFDYGNEQSAVRSFLLTVGNAFAKNGAEVDYAGDMTPKPYQPAGSANGGVAQSIKSFLKKWPWLYQSLVLRSYFKRQDLLVESLKKKGPYDLVVEFHTVGSTVGKQLAAYWKADFSVIFDSPVDEQFYEMHQTKTLFWGHIKSTERQTMEAAQQIMAYSPACKKHIETKYNITGQVGVLPCVIHKSVAENRANKKAFNIVFIGSFLSWHKVDRLVEAFAIFQQDNPHARLQLIGHGVEWERISNLVKAKGLEEKVEMPGFVDEETLLEYKQKANVAVMPGSNWYGSPLKLFEYAFSEIPFIAPATPTVSSIFKDKEHCLFVSEKEEVASLVKAFNFYGQNADQGKEMARQAREFISENFGGEAYAAKLVTALS